MNDNDRRKIENRILEFLRQNPHGITISELARHLKINRITLSKYLDILRVEGLVDYKTVGRAKLYFISEDVSFLEILFGRREILKSISRDNNNFLNLSSELKIIIFPSEIIQDLYLLTEKYNVYNFIRDLGHKYGSHISALYKIYSGVKSEEIKESVIQNLVEFLFRTGFGRIKDFVYNSTKKELILSLDTNIIVEELENLKDVTELKGIKNKPHCLFIEGYLEGLFKGLFNKDFSAKEIKCKLKDDEYCEFLVKERKIEK